MPVETRHKRKSGNNHGFDQEEEIDISLNSQSFEGMEAEDGATPATDIAPKQFDEHGRDKTEWFPSLPLTAEELAAPIPQSEPHFTRLPRIMEVRLQAASGHILYYRDTEHVRRSIVVPAEQCPVWAYVDMTSMTAVMAHPQTQASRHIESALDEQVAGARDLQQEIYRRTPADILASAGLSIHDAAYWPRIGEVLAVKESAEGPKATRVAQRYRVLVVVRPYAPAMGVEKDGYPNANPAGVHSRADINESGTTAASRFTVNNPTDWTGRPASEDTQALGSVPRQNGAMNGPSWNRGPNERQPDGKNLGYKGRQQSPGIRGQQQQHHQQHQGASAGDRHNDGTHTLAGRQSVYNTDYRYQEQPLANSDSSGYTQSSYTRVNGQQLIPNGDVYAADRNNNRSQKHVMINDVPRVIPAQNTSQNRSADEWSAGYNPQNRPVTERWRSPARTGGQERQSDMERWRARSRFDQMPPRNMPNRQQSNRSQSPHRSSADSSFDISDDGRGRPRHPSTSPARNAGDNRHSRRRTPSPPRPRYYRDYSPYTSGDRPNNRESRPPRRPSPIRRSNTPPYRSGYNGDGQYHERGYNRNRTPSPEYGARHSRERYEYRNHDNGMRACASHMRRPYYESESVHRRERQEEIIAHISTHRWHRAPESLKELTEWLDVSENRAILSAVQDLQKQDPLIRYQRSQKEEGQTVREYMSELKWKLGLYGINRITYRPWHSITCYRTYSSRNTGCYLKKQKYHIRR